MQTVFEVRVQLRIPSFFAVFLLCAATPVFSQTSAPGNAVQTMPAYTPQDQTVPSAAKPQPAPAPVAPPAVTTPEIPYRAYMPYGPPAVRKAYDRFSGSVYIPLDN